METLGMRLKKSRERIKKTQSEICKLLGISIGTLSGYERDYRKPETEILRKLASLYLVSTDYLISGKLIRSSEDSNYENSEESSLEKEFLEWIKNSIGGAFFYDFDSAPDERKEQLMKDLRYMWEREKDGSKTKESKKKLEDF